MRAGSDSTYKSTGDFLYTNYCKDAYFGANTPRRDLIHSFADSCFGPTMCQVLDKVLFLYHQKKNQIAVFMSTVINKEANPKVQSAPTVSSITLKLSG